MRSYKGTDGAWFRSGQVRREGHIRAGGLDKDVTVKAVADPAVNDQVDAAYRTKYRRFGGAYVDPMVAPVARATTLQLVPG